MKKTIKTLLVICCLSLLLALGLTSCEKKCEHTYDNACDAICNECGEERAITHTPNADDGNCTTAITCRDCGTTTTPAKDSHTGGTATCTEKAVCTECNTAYGTVDANNHISTEFVVTNNGDGTHDKLYACCEAVHTANEACSGDEDSATCVHSTICEICAHEYGDSRNPDNHASEEFTYTANTDGSTHKKVHVCCGATADEAEAHTFDSTTGKCDCGLQAYTLYVGGERVTGEKLTINGTTGTATYDPENNTLTLTGYTYTGESYGWDDGDYGAAIYYGGSDTLKLELKNTNSVTYSSDASKFGYGVYAKGSITVSGGTLNAVGGEGTDHSYGVYAEGSITVSGGTLNAVGGEANFYSYGVQCEGEIKIDGGSLTATGTYAVDCDGNITVTGGSLTATSDRGQGVWCRGDLTVSGGSLTANSTYLIAVQCDGNITVTGGSLTANRKVSCYGNIALSGGEVLVQGGPAFDGYSGFSCENGYYRYAEDGVFSLGTGNTQVERSSYFAFVGADHVTAAHEGGKHTISCKDADCLLNLRNAETDYTVGYTASGSTIDVSCSANCGHTGTATISATGKTYDGTALEATVTKTGSLAEVAIDVTYAVKNGETLDSTPVNAGAYTASITIGGATVSVDFTIAKADPTYSVPTGLTASCGQTLADVILSGGWAWVDSTQSVGAEGENQFDATFTPTDTTNYNTVTVKVTVSVYKPAASVELEPRHYPREYTGDPQALVYRGVASGGEIQYKVGENGTYSAELPTATDAGDYIVYWKVVGDSNHGDTAEQKINVRIKAKDVSNAAVTLEQESYLYDGNEKKPAVQPVIVDGKILNEGTDYTVEYANNIYVGEATVTITFNGNYSGEITKTFEITQDPDTTEFEGGWVV